MCSCVVEKKEKKKKDKNAPKRPITAFFAYIKGRRDGLKKEQPKLTNTELVSVGHCVTLQKMSVEWKALTEKEKEPYVKVAAKDKDRYTKEKKTYDEKKKSPKKK